MQASIEARAGDLLGLKRTSTPANDVWRDGLRWQHMTSWAADCQLAMYLTPDEADAISEHFANLAAAMRVEAADELTREAQQLGEHEAAS